MDDIITLIIIILIALGGLYAFWVWRKNSKGKGGRGKDQKRGGSPLNEGRDDRHLGGRDD